MDNPEKWNSEEKRLERRERLNDLKMRDGAKKPIKRSNRLMRILAPVIAVVLVLILGIWATISFAIPLKIFSPVTIGGKNVSSVEFSYYYASVLQEIGIDTTTAEGVATLSQTCTVEDYTDKTWQEYAFELVAQTMVKVQIEYDLAVEAGMTLTDDEVQSVQDIFDNLIEQIGDQVSADKYLVSMFGKGVTIDTLQPVFAKQSLATKYATEALADVEVTDEEIEEQYNNNKDSYDTVTFRLVYFETETKTDETTTETAAFDAAAKAKANEFLAKATDEDTFKQLAIEKTEADVKAEEAAAAEAEEAAYAEMTTEEKATEDAARAEEATEKAEAEAAEKAVLAGMTTVERAAYDAAQESKDSSILRGLSKSDLDSASADIGTWFFDTARKAGDKEVFAVDGGYYAVYFLTRDAKQTLPTVRHILISPNADKDISAGDVFTVDEWSEARTAAEALMAQCTSLDAFIALVAENTDDTASAETGGLYEDVERDTMMQEFNDWCFDTDRKTGDMDIVRTDYGYHILYFIENKATTALSRSSEAIQTELSSSKFEAGIKEIEATDKYKYALSDFGIQMFKLFNPMNAADTSTTSTAS